METGPGRPATTAARVSLLAELQATLRRLRYLAAERHKVDAARARSDTRNWAKARRERTRHLIELGGLVQKAGLVELTDDDRATLLGAFLEIADRLQRGEHPGTEGADLLARWRRHGLRAFDADETRAADWNGQKGRGARHHAADG